jgi:hypothetical protein
VQPHNSRLLAARTMNACTACPSIRFPMRSSCRPPAAPAVAEPNLMKST